MSLIIARLKGAGVWVAVGLAVVLLVVFGLWRHAARLAAETRKALADSEARAKAARDSAVRTETLGAQKDAAEATHAEAVQAIAVKHDAALAAAHADEQAALAAGDDADDVVALARKMRAEGKIR